MVGIYDEIIEILEKPGKEIIEFSGIMLNPTYAKVQEGARLARENNVDFILAVGSGSVIDCSKIISVQAKLDEDIYDAEYKKENYQMKEFLLARSLLPLEQEGNECRGCHNL